MNNKTSKKIRLVGTRIREWRKMIPFKGYELAKVLKISQGSLSDIENNKSLPSADTIAKFHTNTNVNILWLLTGKGPMTKEGIALPRAQEMENIESELEMLITRFIRTYQTGDSEKKAMLRGFIEGADTGPA